MSAAEKHKRTVRSFVVRGGRLTPSQQQAMESLWPAFGLPNTKPVDRREIFGREAALVLEIGFGMGDSLAAMALQHPERDYIGIDVHPPGIGTLLREIKARDIHNLRVMRGDAVEVLPACFRDNDLDRIHVFFPDPWHKKRHHKRRLIQPPVVDLLAQKLRPGGILHLATDWANYAQQMMEVMSASAHLCNLAGPGKFSDPGERAETKFERRGRKLGHEVWDLVFEKVE